jgi:sulfatase modifying factor 1
MRPAAPLALAAVLSISALLAAAPPRRAPAPPPQPPADEAPTEPGLAVLRTPGPAEILFRAGTFTMGSSDEEVTLARKVCDAEPRHDDCRDEIFAFEQAQHEVYLSDYWLDRTEVTVARYRRCVAAGPCAMPPYAEGGERFDQPSLPVVLVTWNDARRFCAWAGGRLPTEAEWERAARGAGPNGRRYPWGNVYNPFLANHGAQGLEDLDARDGFLELAPVGSFPDGRTPEGLEDLAGNAQEWVADWFATEYPKADTANPKGPDNGEMRVVRGGSYVHGRLRLRAAARDREPPNERLPWMGFRCARDGT